MTDVAGREPFVILPLDQFEAMAGMTPVVPHQPRSTTLQPEMSSELKALEHEAMPLSAQQEVFVKEVEESPLEERFYLESVDETEGAA